MSGAMVQISCTLGSFAVTGGLWSLARRAANARGLALGTTPYLGLFLVTVTEVALARPIASDALAIATVCVAAWCDARTGYIFDPVVLCGLGMVGAAACISGDLAVTLGGAIVTGGTLLALRALTGARGLGLGDVKLAAVIGAGIGPAYGSVALGAAFLCGAAVGLARIALGRARLRDAVRFGPYLAAGTLMVLAYHRLNTGVIR